MNFSNILDNFGKNISKFYPEIALGAGLSLIVGGSILAVSKTKKALHDIEDTKDAIKKKEHIPEDVDISLTRKEIITSTYKEYILPAAMEIAGIGLIIFADCSHLKREGELQNALLALSGSYKATDMALKEYRKRVKDSLGDEKEKELYSKAREYNNPEINFDNIPRFGNGTILYKDSITNVIFYSDRETIREHINNFNSKLLSLDYQSLNDWYSELGLESSSIGNILGWNSNRNKLRVIVNNADTTINGIPCILLEYESLPYFDYDSYYV